MSETIVLQKRWVTPDEIDQAAVERLQRLTRLPLLVCRLLVQRGVTEVEEARAFLQPRLEHLHDPFLMKGVGDLVDRLLAAKERGDRIGIHGDYDVDGITSTTLYTQVLRQLGFDVVPFVPHRMIDGYGVSVRALEQFRDEGVRVVLTGDTGFSAVDEVRYGIEELGLTVLITDHHTPPEVLPKADVLVNPHQKGCPYPFKDLCGVGVAFKVLQALVQRMGLDQKEVLWPYLDLVALGTICDVVPLRGENRIFAKWGLRVARESRNLGLRTLFEICSIPIGKVDEGTFGWIIGPHLNAAGRIDDAAKALRLMLATDEEEARALAEEIHQLNVRRRTQTQEILKSAHQLIAEGPDLDELYGIVLFDDGTLPCQWHHGVIGIVASKIVETYGRAAFLFARDEKSGKWKGSGRAPSRIASVNLYDALVACEDMLLKFGGHAAAAGATLKAKNRADLVRFAKAFNEAMRKQMRPEDRIPTLYADLEVRLEDLTTDLWAMLRRFEPFGLGNEAINMIARGVEVLSVSVVGEDKTHLKFRLRQGDVVLDAVGWGFADQYPDALKLGKGAKLDVFFRLQENVYRGHFKLQLVLQDLRIVDPGQPQVQEEAQPAFMQSRPAQRRLPAHAVDSRYAPKNLFA